MAADGTERLRPAASSLFRSKLRDPAPPEHLVVRPRLLQLLDEAVKGSLTLVIAPAGAGKTSLMAHWTAESATPCVWFTLDELDRDSIQLWLGVAASLDQLEPVAGKDAIASIQRSRDSRQAVATLLDELEMRDRPVSALILDIVHLVDENPEVAA